MKKPTTERDGMAFAVKMLTEIEVDHRADMFGPSQREEGGPWPLSIEAMYRAEGTQQDNIVLRYLDSIRDCPEAMAGFCAVLTDHLFSSIVGGLDLWPDYGDLTDHEIHGTPGRPWPSMDDDVDDEERDPQFRSFMSRLGLPGGDAAH